ncbi:ATP-binding cassette domain-containing protein [Candidatus Dependentiae bacterium]|nr:ATP-binding cassette domain-containing protein [Candidatus Dependentiae bacterium]
MLKVLRKLRALLSRREKWFLMLIFISSVFVSFLETFSISLVMVFASIATNFGVINSNKYYNYLYKILGCSNQINFVILFGLLLILFYFFRAFVITIFTYGMNRFSQGRQRHFALRFFQNYLNFKYKEFTSKNSSRISKVILGDTADLTSILDSLLQITAESLNVIFIYSALLFVNWKMTLVLSFLLCIKVLLIVSFFSTRLKSAGKIRHKLNIAALRTYTESFWNFKLIKLFSTQDIVLKRFNKASSELVKANTLNAVLQNAPRLILETIGFSILIAAIVYVVYMYHNATAVIPTISMYAFAFYRFLPSLNKIIAAYNKISFLKPTLDSVQEYLGYELEYLDDKKINFKNSILLNNLNFEYDSKNKVLSKVNIKIKKGERTAFIGESGAGKSTIVDIIMGLYKPTDGNIFIDNQILTNKNVKSWRNKIGYIPQQIYLFDGTVAENVILGRQYNKKRVIESLKKANIYNFLSTKDGINTKVGESGILLSGGQKQRVAIARALYSDPDVLVLDEATSALDNQTEEKIMNEIYSINKDKTLIVIAHRLSTVERCDTIYKIDKRNIFLVNNISDIYSSPKKAMEVNV